MKSLKLLFALFLFIPFMINGQECPQFDLPQVQRATADCDQDFIECTSIDYEFVGDYDITLNGNPYNGNYLPCGFTTTYSYDLLGIPSYPVTIVEWVVDSMTYTNITVSSGESLADTMSVLSSATWTFDDDNFTVFTSDNIVNPGRLYLVEMTNGLTAEIYPTVSTIPSGTSFEFPIGQNNMTIYDPLNDCSTDFFIEVICDSTICQVDTTHFFSHTCDPNNAGTSQVVLTNSLGCDSVIITQIDLLPSDITEIFTTICDPSQPGSYTDTLTNQYGCDSIINTIVEPLELTYNYNTEDACNSVAGIFEISNLQGGIPPYNFNWSDGNMTDSNRDDLAAGTYSLSITDSQGCETSLVFDIGLDTLVFSLESFMHSYCGLGGSATFSNPDLNYYWSDGGEGYIRDNLAPGGYSITITDNSGECETNRNIYIYDYSLTVNTFVGHVCDTLGSIWPSVGGGSGIYSFDWEDLAGTDDPQYRYDLEVGIYSLTVTDSEGCTASESYEIVDNCNNPSEITWNFIPEDTMINCEEMLPDPALVEAMTSCTIGEVDMNYFETFSPGTCYDDGTITRYWSASDDCGNVSNIFQTIEIVDLFAPEILGADTVFVDLSNGDTIPTPETLVVITDNCNDTLDISYTFTQVITTIGYEIVYEWQAIDPCGNLATSTQVVHVNDGIVWPGDVDSNNVVNNLDIFNIGFAYDQTGSARIHPTIDFLPQYAAPWTENGSNDVNYRHADTDGNGVVNQEDLLAINQNYEMMHNLQEDEQGDTRESFPIQFELDQITADNWVYVNVLLGDGSATIDDFYGAGFVIEYDKNLVEENTAHLDFNNSWIGTFVDDFIAIQKDFYDEGRLDIGLVRINQTGVDGQGVIGSFRFQLKDGVNFESMMLTARDGAGVRADKTTYDLDDVETVITNTDDLLPSTAIRVFPNPAKDQLNVEVSTETLVEEISIINTQGQLVKLIKNPNQTLSLRSIPTGIYFIKIITNSGYWLEKVSVIK